MTDTTDEWLGRLEHPHPAERAEAAFALGSAVDDRAAVIAALRLRLTDVDPEVGEAAAASLANHGDQGSLDAILQRLLTGQPRDRIGSAWAAAVLAHGVRKKAAQQGARSALMAYHRRARGFSRDHAALLLAELGVQASPAQRKPNAPEPTDDSCNT